MTPNPRHLAAAGAVALAIWLATGLIPDAPTAPARKFYRSTVLAQCDTAKAMLDGETLQCDSTSPVVVTVEQVIDPDNLSDGDLPAGVVPFAGSMQEVTEADMRRPSKALTTRPPPSDCLAGTLRKDVSELANGSVYREGLQTCCGVRCECVDPPCVVIPSTELAGRETWRTRLCEQRPEHQSCAQ